MRFFALFLKHPIGTCLLALALVGLACWPGLSARRRKP